MHIYKYKEAGEEKPERPAWQMLYAPSTEQRASKQVKLEYKSQCIEMVTVSGLLLVTYVRLCQSMLRCEYFWLHHSTGATNTGKRDEADLRCPDIVEVVIYTLMYNCTCTHSTWLMLCLLGGPDLPPYVDFRDPPTHWHTQSQNTTVSMTSK